MNKCRGLEVGMRLACLENRKAAVTVGRELAGAVARARSQAEGLVSQSKEWASLQHSGKPFQRVKLGVVVW